ncbi:hypothetical protein PG984_003903 [Apiospora sp. TS-2023a]
MARTRTRLRLMPRPQPNPQSPSHPQFPLPPFCSQSTVEVDSSQIPAISHHDIEVHLNLLGLIDLNLDLDVGSLLKGILGGKRRRDLIGDLTSGITSGKGNGKGSGNPLGSDSLPIVGPIINAPGKKEENPKPVNPKPVKSTDPELPPGADPEAIRRALIHQYTVQCGFSYRSHRDVQTTTVTSYTECLHTCTTHAFSSSTPGGAHECLGASFERAGSGKCWYVVGTEHSTLDESYRVQDDSCDSFSLDSY